MYNKSYEIKHVTNDVFHKSLEPICSAYLSAFSILVFCWMHSGRHESTHYFGRMYIF